MTDIIIKALKDCNVGTWSLWDNTVDDAELFFIKHSLDMRRMKSTRKYELTVYRDFENGGAAMRGLSSVTVVPSQTYEEVAKAVKSAYFAAGFVPNPTYRLPDAVCAAHAEIESDLAGLSVEDAAIKMAEALYSAETDADSFINSAEFFAEKKNCHFISSWGSDVGYTKYTVRGEFVVQCKQPEDVETYHEFAYDTLDTGALREKAAEALAQVKDRAVAKPELPTGTYNLILSGDTVAEVLSYYVARSSAQMIFPKYSSWKTGDYIQSGDPANEKLNISLHASVPFSREGIKMTDRELIADGTVKVIHGAARLCSYLDVEPTGDYEAYGCGNGTVRFADMKNTPYLYAVAFSDFQMDVMTGNFGGEIRLAYWFDGERVRIVTGGSVNGNITDKSGRTEYSVERYECESYRGPLAMKFSGVTVAGTV